MKIKYKEWEQFIPRSLDEVWHFFSRPENLNAITPDDMAFEILSDIEGRQMYPGMIILYKVSPFFGFKMDWATEITHIKKSSYFIDEQRFGPYAFWRHQHHFEEKNDGVLMRDMLHYKVPYGPIGSLADALFVDRQIEQIFNYRIKAVERIFDFATAETF